MDKGEFYKVRVNGHLVGFSRDIDEALKMYHAVKEAVLFLRSFLRSDANVVLHDTDDTVFNEGGIKYEIEIQMERRKQ